MIAFIIALAILAFVYYKLASTDMRFGDNVERYLEPGTLQYEHEAAIARKEKIKVILSKFNV